MKSKHVCGPCRIQDKREPEAADEAPATRLR